MEKIKWSEKVTNEQVLERIGEKRTLLNIILRINCLLHDATEGQITEVKEVGRTQFLDCFRNGRYWELKGEAKDRNRWKRQFINHT